MKTDMTLIIVLFLILTACILGRSSLSMSYAALGLELWFRSMIPALLPFMILSGVMVRLKLTERIAGAVYPVLGPLYRVRENVVYCMALGFLCGFPMGAKATAELYERGRLTRQEAGYLLAFCNNIGPVYFLSFALPLLGRQSVFPYLFGMYGIPLLYGLLLRGTIFRELPPGAFRPSGGRLRRLLPGRFSHAPSSGPHRLRQSRCISGGSTGCAESRQAAGRLLSAVNESVRSSLQSILDLGGYMILFNLLNLPLHILLGAKPALFAPMLEITGGLSMSGGARPLYSLLALSFGGLSCIAQTYSCISATDLDLGGYVLHKMILTLLNGGFYLCWFLLSPSTFLR